LKNQEAKIKNIFEVIANAEDGAILFHCSWGRDRTGIIAMFLLGLVHVNKQDIIQNYAITYDLIKDLEYVKQDVLALGERKMQTLPEYIKKAINHIQENYATFENYLLACGISQEDLNKIKARFVL